MSGNLTNLGYSAQTKNLYVSNIYYENDTGTVTINLPVGFVNNTIQKILFDNLGNLDTLGAFKLYSGTDLGSVFTSTNRYSIQLNSSNSFEIFDNVANDWRIRIDSVTGVTTFNPPTVTPTVNDGILTITNGTYITGSGTFTANQAGNTSITIGTNATPSNTPSTLVARDSSGIFAGGLSGNATSASSVYVIQNSANADLQIPILSTTHTGAGNYALKVDGNTAILTYNTNSHTLKPVNINLSGTFADSSGSVGTSGQFLSSTVTGTSWKTQPASSFINTTAISNDAIYFPVFVDSSGNQLSEIPYTSSNITLQNDSTGGVFSANTMSTGILAVSTGISITDSGTLNLFNTSLNSFALNTTGANVLDFTYIGTSKATLTSTGTFNTIILQASSQIHAKDTGVGLTANYSYITRASGITYFGSTVSGSPTNQLTITTAGVQVVSGTLTAPTITATSQINAADTGVGLTANVTYITRASGITYIGSTVSGTPLNQLTIDVFRTEFITGGGRYDQKDNNVANQQGICFFTSGILYQQNFVAGVLNNVYYGNHVNFAIVGNLFAASYSISCESRKQNIEDLCPCYSANFISKLKPKKYQYKKIYDASGNETTRPDIDRKTCFGFLAQDVKADICGCEDLGIHVEGDGDKFPQALSYMEIIAPLVKVVQNLMSEIELLKAQVKVLELKVNV